MTEQTNKCNHKDGWILKEEICVSIDTEKDNYDYDIEADFECNNLDCKVRKRFKFSIDNFKEVQN